MLVFLGLAFGHAEDSRGSVFSVNPVQITLASSSASQLLTIQNVSDRILRFQLTVWKWDQDPQGEMVLLPTRDIVFFPPLFTLAPKDERKIRIGATTPVGTVEKTYRIFVEELPSPGGPEAVNGVNVLTKVGIPIFLRPTTPRARGSLEDLAVHDGILSFRVQNSGTLHVMIQTLRVRGYSMPGEMVLDRQLTGWYLLAGGSRLYALPLPRPDCTRILALAIDVQLDESKLTDRIETPTSACGP